MRLRLKFCCIRQDSFNILTIDIDKCKFSNILANILAIDIEKYQFPRYWLTSWQYILNKVNLTRCWLVDLYIHPVIDNI